jgi:hypothetical protein
VGHCITKTLAIVKPIIVPLLLKKEEPYKYEEQNCKEGKDKG